jgi:hypothetical protein
VKAPLFYRISSVLLVLFAAGHTIGFRQNNPEWHADAVLAVMRRASAGNFETRAGHRLGAGALLCSSHSTDLEIRLHHSPRFLNSDYRMFDCGGVAF